MADTTIDPQIFEARRTDDPIYEYRRVEFCNVVCAGARGYEEDLVRAALDMVLELNRSNGKGWTLYFIQARPGQKTPTACFRKVLLPLRSIAY